MAITLVNRRPGRHPQAQMFLSARTVGLLAERKFGNRCFPLAGLRFASRVDVDDYLRVPSRNRQSFLTLSSTANTWLCAVKRVVSTFVRKSSDNSSLRGRP